MKIKTEAIEAYAGSDAAYPCEDAAWAETIANFKAIQEAAAILTRILDRLAMAETSAVSQSNQVSKLAADLAGTFTTIADLQARLDRANGLIAEVQQAIAGCHDLQRVVPALGKLAEYKP